MAIFLALYSKNVVISLLGGIVLGELILNHFNISVSLQQLLHLFLSLLSQGWILKTLAFALLVGSIMALVAKSGGIGGFVEYLHNKKKLVASPRAALMLSYFVGVFIFVESSITSLIAGAVGRPFCDKYKISHAKLAFVCDSTSAPISSLIVLNGWGALLLGLITTQIQDANLELNPLEVLMNAVIYNFYSLSALAVTFLAIYFNINIGAMKHSKYIVSNENIAQGERETHMFHMLFPIILMIVFVFVFLYITGNGDILKGSGSSAIFYTMLLTLLVTLYYVFIKNMSFATWGKTAFKGAKHLAPIVLVLFFAFGIGEVSSQLHTGEYLASLANENISVYFLAAIIFLLSAIISFSTGTSWGTFSIMIPVAVPMAVAMDGDISLAVAAVISGGVFGDHCSPISDTTIISSLASECDVIEHVQTQLPYALISGVIALVFFILFSIF